MTCSVVLRTHPATFPFGHTSLMNAAGLYLVTVLIWGSSWFAITFQIGVVDEAVSVFYRFFLAAVILLVFCLGTGRRLKFSATEHGFIALQGLCLFCLNYVLIYYGTAYISSGVVAVIFSTLAICNIFNGAVFLKRSVKPAVLMGAILGLVGIALVFGHELSQARATTGTADLWKGFLFVLIAAYSASLGNILSARNQQQGLPVLQTNAFGTLYGSLLMLVYAMLLGAEFLIEWSVPFTFSLIYLSVFGTIFAFGAYLSLVGRIGADKAAYATVLFPLVALLISTVFENFEWTRLSLVGVALVIAGNILVVGLKPIKELLHSVQQRAMPE